MNIDAIERRSRESTLTRKEEIYREASRLFFKKGYHATGMRELGKAVGVEQAVLYYYYSSKVEILYDIMKTASIALMKSVEVSMKTAGTTSEKLEVFLTAHMSHFLRYREEVGMSYVEFRNLKPEQQAELREWQLDYLKKFRQLLDHGVEEGVFRPVDTRAVTMFLLAGTTSMASWYQPGGRLTAEEMARVFADTIANGLLRQTE